MKTIQVRNVNDALAAGIDHLLLHGTRETSRNGSVIVAPSPVMTEYQRPRERVLFSPLRDANPFFHLMEALWMLAGRNDLAWPVFFNSNFKNYSDDGVTCWGAYGHRWRRWFGLDQLGLIARELILHPDSRRAVLQMWCGAHDLAQVGAGGRDVPCNTTAYFDLRGGVLNMTVCNRSNDAIWGAYGANAVHFSILQEYLAAWISVDVGVYRQFSNNLHVYTDIYNEEKLRAISAQCTKFNLYAKEPKVAVVPLIAGRGHNAAHRWAAELFQFMAAPHDPPVQDPFFTEVARPMYNAWEARRKKQPTLLERQEIAPSDWALAAELWLMRREGNAQ